MQVLNAPVPFFHKERNIKRNRLLEAIDHPLHQREDLPVDVIDLVHRQSDIIERRLLPVGLSRHQAVVDLEAIDFLVYSPIIVGQRTGPLDYFVDPLL